MSDNATTTTTVTTEDMNLRSEIQKFVWSTDKDPRDALALLTKISDNRYLINKLTDFRSCDEIEKSILMSRIIYMFNRWLNPDKYTRKREKEVPVKPLRTLLHSQKETHTYRIYPLINKFLKSPASYEEGVKLLSRITPNQKLLVSLSKGRTPKNQKKLIYELSRFAEDISFSRI